MKRSALVPKRNQRDVVIVTTRKLRYSEEDALFISLDGEEEEAKGRDFESRKKNRDFRNQ